MNRLATRDVIQCITRLVKPGRTVLVGIDGGAGAGKTTFTRYFAEQIRERIVSPDKAFQPIPTARILNENRLARVSRFGV